MGIEDARVKEDGETPSGWKYVGRRVKDRPLPAPVPSCALYC
jgi:hypothetical protein